MTQSLVAGDVSVDELRRVRRLVEDLPDGSALAIVLEKLLQAVMSGEDVTVYTSEKDLTTSQAAQILNVSRPFVTKLMVEGLLGSHMVGSHHRCRLSDVQDYIERRERAAADVARVVEAPAHVQREYMRLAGEVTSDVNDELAALGFQPIKG